MDPYENTSEGFIIEAWREILIWNSGSTPRRPFQKIRAWRLICSAALLIVVQQNDKRQAIFSASCVINFCPLLQLVITHLAIPVLQNFFEEHSFDYIVSVLTEDFSAIDMETIPISKIVLQS